MAPPQVLDLLMNTIVWGLGASVGQLAIGIIRITAFIFDRSRIKFTPSFRLLVRRLSRAQLYPSPNDHDDSAPDPTFRDHQEPSLAGRAAAFAFLYVVNVIVYVIIALEAWKQAWKCADVWALVFFLLSPPLGLLFMVPSMGLLSKCFDWLANRVTSSSTGLEDRSSAQEDRIPLSLRKYD